VPEVVSAAAFGYVGRMRGLVAVAAVGAAFYGAGVAHAGTVTLANGVMAFEAGAGEANRVFVIRDDDGMHLVDTAVPVTAGGGCTPENTTEVFCASEDLTLLEIDVVAGDENDYIDLRPAGAFLASKLNGGDGNDTLLGGFAFSGNVLDGGVGADKFGGDWGATVDYSERTNPVTVTIGDDLPNDGEAGEGDFVSAGIDQVYGGHAADTITAMNVQGVNRTYLRGGEGNDHLSALQVDWTSIAEGGAGDDVLRIAGPDSTIFGGIGDDVLSGAHGGQALWGQQGEDTLRGLAGNDLLHGGPDADHLNGGPAKDQVFGDDGNDTFMARDGKRDSLDGGGGKDKARVDAIDHLARIEATF
jgi:Ca2+-binding RTX toxin-like protein